MSINSTNNDSSVTYEKTGNRAKALIDIYAKSNEGLNIEWTHYENNVATNYQGWKAYMTVRDIKDGNIIALRCVPIDEAQEGEGTIELTTAGQIRIKASYEALSQVYTSSMWKYDVLLISPAGVRSRFVEGTFYINRSATYGS